MSNAAAHSKPVRLAHAALRAGVVGKWKTVEALLNRINAECPGPGLGDALVAWCDALAEHSNDGMPEFGRIKVAHLNADTGAMNKRDEITPERAWAARLVAARGAGDRAAFESLLDELNAIPDGFERGRYATTLVESVAGTIRTLPRGYAHMGRPAIDRAGYTLIEKDDDRHLIEFRADGWTIKHPLLCRPDLFACKVNRAAESALTAPPPNLGVFECTVDEAGRFSIGNLVQQGGGDTRG